MRLTPRRLFCSTTFAAALWFSHASAPGTSLVETIDFNANGADFTVASTNSPGGPWAHNAAQGTWAAFDQDGCGAVAFRASRLNSPILTLPAAETVAISFNHRYSFEADTTRWDGGQLRVSVNHGPYTMVPLASFTVNGYNNTVGGAAVPNSELFGQQAFTAQSAGYATPAFITSVAGLGTFNANDTISIQFLAAWDDCSQGLVPNWEIDSVTFDPPLEDRKSAPLFRSPALPADALVVEHLSHTLLADVIAVPPPTLQWIKDDVAISGATNSAYTITNMSMSETGRYFLRAMNSVGTTTSRVATISFVPDRLPPTFVSGLLRQDNTILLSFSEPMDVSYGLDPFNVSIFPAGGDPADDGLTVASATLTNQTNFVITLQSPPTPDADYSLGLLNGVVADLALNTYESGFEDAVYRILPLNREAAIILIDATPRWKYNDQNIDFQSRTPSVFDVSFDDSSWPTGAALLGTETAATPEPIRTPAANAPLTTYYRTRFTLPTTPVVSWRMRTVVDDGARVFLNGTEIFRTAGMPPIPTPMSFGAAAGRAIGNGAYEGPFTLPTSNLLVGENLMVVALHQAAAGSSDNLWGCELIATIGPGLGQSRITNLFVNGVGDTILEHSGSGMYIQEATSFAHPASAWVTRPGGPHASPHDAGPASGIRFFRLTNTP